MENEEPSNLPPDSSGALDALVERTYQKVKSIAARMPGVRPGASISPTVVANETYLKFLRSRNSQELAHREVMGLFVGLMKEILVDLVRRRKAQKRGGGQQHELVDDLAERLSDPKTASLSPEDILALRDSIDRLRIVNQRQAEIIEGRFYLGLTLGELAGLFEISVATIERECCAALAFLHAALRKTNGVRRHYGPQ